MLNCFGLTWQDSPYVVVPMTFDPEKEGGFMLNIWHKSPILVHP